MCSWRRVAVARVFALVVRCRIMMLFVYSRVGINRDTRRGSPATAGAGRIAITNLSVYQRGTRGAEGNCIYRPVSISAFINHFLVFTFENMTSKTGIARMNTPKASNKI